MAKSTKLLLVENVDSLGIVGDVVNVRLGYARNFLLPRALATTPSDELVAQLASRRAEAQKQVAAQRKQREDISSKLEGVELTLVKSCNDQGILYGAVTQQELAAALVEKGYGVKPRDVRLHEVIKRVGSYDVHVKLDSDLDAHLRLKVDPDRELDSGDGEPVAAASSEHARTDAFAEAMKADAAKSTGWGPKKSDEPADAKGDKKPAKPKKGEDAKGEKPEKKPAKK